jgi:hypothetical protein
MWYDSSHMSPEKKKLKKKHYAAVCYQSCSKPGKAPATIVLEKKTSVRTSTVARLHCPVHTRSCQLPLPTWPGLEKKDYYWSVPVRQGLDWSKADGTSCLVFYLPSV